MKPEEIINILHSIKAVRLMNDEVEVKFDNPDPVWVDGWQPNAGFIYNSFTRELLNLIEDSLKGELNENNNEH